MYRKLLARFVSRNAYYKSSYDMIPSNYTSFEQLVKVYNYSSPDIEFHTQKNISFKNNLNFGSNKRTVYKLLGKPVAEFKNPHVKDHTILLYKFLLGFNRTRCEIHLFKNRFFMGLYTFDFTSTYFPVIKKELTGKYLDKKMDLNNIIISDKKNHRIFINERIMNFTIMYFSADVELHDRVIALMEQRDVEIREQEKEMISKLKRDL